MDALLNRLFPESKDFGWQMELCERAVLELLVRRIEPEVAIEVGTADGGSLSATAPFCERFFSLDVKHADELREKIGSRFKHVELVTGDSRETLPELLERIEKEDASLEYVLIDGGHSRTLVREDMSNVIKHRPKKELVMVGHDSFNPACRQGQIDVDWASSPWVHRVQIDAVPGILWQQGEIDLQQWGGFIIVEMSHEERKGELKIDQRQGLKHSILSRLSAHKGSLMDSIKMAFEMNRRRKAAAKE